MKEDKLSDDNDKVIDKHSGYIIKFIEFDDSEDMMKVDTKLYLEKLCLKTLTCKVLLILL